MREIKFRAWVLTDEAGKPFNRPYMEYEMDHSVDWFGEHEKGYLRLLQYTGLKDKNGKEIYEGDIVKHCRPNWGHKKNQTFVVEWEERYYEGQLVLAGWKFEQLHKGFSTVYTPSVDFEVISNMYENPELLEGK